MRQGHCHRHGRVCRSGVRGKRQHHQASRMACRLWQGEWRREQQPRGNRRHSLLAGRRHAGTESRLHHGGKDQTQAAAYRSHPAVRDGNGWQGDRGRRIAAGYEGLRHRHARHPCVHHRNAFQARLYGTLQEVACPHRKRACPLLGREGDAYCRCRHDGRMGKGIGTHRAWGTARR